MSTFDKSNLTMKVPEGMVAQVFHDGEWVEPLAMATEFDKYLWIPALVSGDDGWRVFAKRDIRIVPKKKRIFYFIYRNTVLNVMMLSGIFYSEKEMKEYERHYTESSQIKAEVIKYYEDEIVENGNE